MKFFGPNKRDIWEQFSREIEGEFNSSAMTVIKKFKTYTIELTTESGRNSPVYTIISCIFPNKHNLKFKIIGDYYERYIFNYTKLTDYIITNDELKSKYIIRSNSRFIIDQLLNEPDIVKYLLENRDIFIEYKPTNMMESDAPGSDSIFKLSILGTVMDNSLLRDLFELSANIITVIDNLHSSEKNPLVVKDPNILDVIKSSAKNLYETSEKINSLTNKIIHKNNTHNQPLEDISSTKSITQKNTNSNENIASTTISKESLDFIEQKDINSTDYEELKPDASFDSLNMDDLTISTDDLTVSTDDLIVPSVSIEDNLQE